MGKLPITITTGRYIKERIDILYPIITGIPNMNVQRNLNSIITYVVNKMIQDQGYYENNQTQISGYYEIKTNERGVLSISLIHYSYSGGAHGITIIKSLSFDVQTGRLSRLADLFKQNSQYKEKISAIIEQQIAKRDIFLLDDFKGIDDDQDFYIADKALVIYFQLYELTAYAFGFPYFPISIYEIENIIDEQSILGKMFM